MHLCFQCSDMILMINPIVMAALDPQPAGLLIPSDLENPQSPTPPTNSRLDAVIAAALLTLLPTQFKAG